MIGGGANLGDKRSSWISSSEGVISLAALASETKHVSAREAASAKMKVGVSATNPRSMLSQATRSKCLRSWRGVVCDGFIMMDVASVRE